MLLRYQHIAAEDRVHQVMAHRRVCAWPGGLQGAPLAPTPRDGSTTTTVVRTSTVDHSVSKRRPGHSQSTHLAYAVRALLRTAYGGRRGGRRPSYAVQWLGWASLVRSSALELRTPRAYAVRVSNCVHGRSPGWHLRVAFRHQPRTQFGLSAQPSGPPAAGK